MNMEATTGLTGLGSIALSPVGRETVQDRIYRQLRIALIQARFDAGEIFLAGDIAQRMSVSSMPVREALARLVSERALEAMPNRRVRVPLITLERARDIAQARALIESELAARALGNLSTDDIERLDQLTAEYEDTSDAAGCRHAQPCLPFPALPRRPDRRCFMPIVESLWMQAGPYVRAAAQSCTAR
jgi:DNA-binding GntR family transcriptional regulator